VLARSKTPVGKLDCASEAGGRRPRIVNNREVRELGRDGIRERAAKCDARAGGPDLVGPHLTLLEDAVRDGSRRRRPLERTPPKRDLIGCFTRRE
jgi:hypothetical protein